MNQQTEEIEITNRNISGVSTSVITALLIAFLILLQFKVDPTPLNEEGGVAVSLGEPDKGGPAEVPVEAYQPPSTPKFEPRVDEQTVDPDAIPVPKTPVVKKTEAAKDPQPDDIIKRMAEQAKNNQNKPENGGTGTKPGAQGLPTGEEGGKPDGTGGKNGGASTGIDPKGTKPGTTHTFGNRRMIEPSNDENCGASGTVIVDVILKADGTVVPQGINPSTKSSVTCLHNLAIKLARKTKFAASTDSKSAEGTITFKFTY